MKRDQLDEVLERFEHVDSEEVDEYHQRREILYRRGHDIHEQEVIREKQQRLWFGMTAEEKSDFNTAFRVISGGRETIPGSKVYDLIQAVGLSLLPSQIKGILDTCITDRNGEYNCSTLETAVDKFICNMVNIKDIRAIFDSLSESGELPPYFLNVDETLLLSPTPSRPTSSTSRSPKSIFPNSVKSLGKNLSDAIAALDIAPAKDAADYDKSISWENLWKYLNRLLNSINVEDQLTPDEVQDVIAEVSVTSNQRMTFVDFVSMFRIA